MNSILPLPPAPRRPLTPPHATSRRRAFASVVLAATALFHSVAHAEPMDNWTKVTVAADVVKSPNDLIFVNQEYWAVGGTGKVQHSPDGKNWTVIQTPVTTQLVSIAYGNGMYVATGFNLVILSSPDGANWTVRNQDPNAGYSTFDKVIYANGKFITVGGKGLVRLSTNGIDWTPATMAGSSFYPESVVWGNGLYVAVGDIDGSYTVQTSPDGITWTRRNVSFSTGFKSVAFYNGVFVAGGTAQLATSTNGTTWTKVTNVSFPYTNSSVWDIKPLNGRFFAFGQHGMLLSSPNGTDWTKHNAGTTADVSTLHYDGKNLLMSRYSIISSGQGFQVSDPWAPVSAPGGEDPTTPGPGTPGNPGPGTPGTGGSQIGNLSTRAWVGVNESQLISGFVINGAGSKKVLVRAIGPTLGVFGIQGALADPQLRIVNSAGTEVATNNDWGANVNQADIAAATTAVGAFALPAGSKDAVSLVTLPPGAYNLVISGGDNGTGVALAEVYDVDAQTGCKLINIASRGFVGAGVNAAIPGFVVAGSAPRKLLIRGVGPTLGGFGVGGVIADPRITLFNASNAKVAENDNWGSGDATAISTAATQVGAFALASGSADAAMLVTVNPGAYTVVVSGANDNMTGVGLVEVYEVP